MEGKVGYYHKRLDTGEIFYVGIGTPSRPYEDKHRNNHWNHIVEKVGHKVILVEENLSWDEACEWEKFEIKRIGRKDLGLGPLVNMTDGGDGTSGAIRSDEFKKKVSNFHSNKKVSNETKLLIQEKRKNQVMTEEHCKNISLGLMGKTKGKPSPLKGTVRPQEVGEKISKSKLGHTVSDETRIKLSQKLKGNTYQTNVLVLDGTLKKFILDNPTMGYKKISKSLGIGKNTVLKMKRELLHIIK